jgi:hypothetical protein
MMESFKQITNIIMRLSALEARNQDAIAGARRVEDKLDLIIQRLTALEVQQNYMRENVKTEIVGEIKADIAVFGERLRSYESILKLDDAINS